MKLGTVRRNFSCNGCMERYPACHDTCERHKKELADFERDKEMVKQKLDYERLASSLVMKRYARATKSKLAEI